MAVTTAQIEGKLSKLSEDAAAVGVLRRSCKETAEAIATARQDLRELAEEHALERERIDRAELRLTEHDKQLTRLAKAETVAAEIDEINARIRSHDEDLARRFAMLRQDHDIVRNDLDAITAKFVDESLPRLLENVDDMSSRMDKMRNELNESATRAALDAKDREQLQAKVAAVLDTDLLGRLGELASVSAARHAELGSQGRAVEAELEKLKVLASQTDDILGKDGTHFFELVQHVEDCQASTSGLATRLAQAEARVDRGEEVQLLKLERLKEDSHLPGLEPKGGDQATSASYYELLQRVAAEEQRTTAMEREIAELRSAPRPGAPPGASGDADFSARVYAVEAQLKSLQTSPHAPHAPHGDSGASQVELVALEQRVGAVEVRVRVLGEKVDHFGGGGAMPGAFPPPAFAPSAYAMPPVSVPHYMPTSPRPIKLLASDEPGDLTVEPVAREICSGDVRIDGARAFWTVAVEENVPVLSPPFVLAGVDARLKLLPRAGTSQGEPIPCGLYLRCSAGTHITFRLFSNGTWHEPLNGDYPKRKDKGKHLVGSFFGAATFGAELLEQV